MTCDRCGAPTTRSRLCQQCGLEEHQESREPSPGSIYECPTCGGPTSGKDAECRHCRRDDDQQTIRGP